MLLMLSQVYAIVNELHFTEGQLIRKRLAYLDQDTVNNTVEFTFERGVTNKAVYPGRNPAI